MESSSGRSVRGCGHRGVGYGDRQAGAPIWFLYILLSVIQDQICSARTFFCVAHRFYLMPAPWFLHSINIDHFRWKPASKERIIDQNQGCSKAFYCELVCKFECDKHTGISKDQANTFFLLGELRFSVRLYRPCHRASRNLSGKSNQI